jgi:hypothetical protein
MRYDTIKDLNPPEFKRLTGVKPETFETMLEWLTETTRIFGRPSKLSLADQLLMTLLYWREYRTLFHLGQDFGLSESATSRIVRKIEDRLIQSERFHLPGKKTLTDSDTEIEVVVVDVTESPVERPKKGSESATPERRSGTPRSLN